MSKALFIILILSLLGASQALAAEGGKRKQVKNNLYAGRRFSVNLKPGVYVLATKTPNKADASAQLRLVNDPIPDCFVRSHYRNSELQDLRLVYPGGNGFFEVTQPCDLRFEITKYERGIVNIRNVEKIKTVEIGSDWTKVKFSKGRWETFNSGFSADIVIEVDATRIPAHCQAQVPKNGHVWGMPGNFFITPYFAANFREHCNLYLRSLKYKSENEKQPGDEFTSGPRVTVAFARH